MGAGAALTCDEAATGAEGASVTALVCSAMAAATAPARVTSAQLVPRISRVPCSAAPLESGKLETPITRALFEHRDAKSVVLYLGDRIAQVNGLDWRAWSGK